MKWLGMMVVLVGGLFLSGASAIAQVTFFDMTVPYEPHLVGNDIEEQQIIYGELLGYPHMYEFELSATSSVPVQVRAVDEATVPEFSLILVADEGSAGVREVFRLAARESVWEPYLDTGTRMSYLVSEELEPVLEPGVYRLEVSTPDNQGRYSILFGDEAASVVYFARFSEIRSIHNFHNYGPLHMFRTAHVYMPMLLMLVLVGLFFTWRYARRNRLV